MFVPEFKEAFMKSSAAKEWYYENLLATDTILLITGSQKSGKSTFCLNLLDSITSKKPFFNLPLISKSNPRVLYINYEMSASDLRMRVSPLAFKDIALVRNGNVCDMSVSDSLLKLQDLCHNYDIIAFDTLSRCGSFDENSSTAMGALMKFFISLRDANKSVILVHHNSKIGRTRGSSVIDAQVDSKLNLTKCANKFIASMEYSRCSDLCISFAYTIEKRDNSLLLKMLPSSKYDYVLLAIKNGLNTGTKLVKAGILSTKNVSKVLKEMEESKEIYRISDGKAKILKVKE